jgi:hypothetical protein
VAETSIVNAAYARMTTSYEEFEDVLHPPDYIGVSPQSAKGMFNIYLENGLIQTILHKTTPTLRVDQVALNHVMWHFSALPPEGPDILDLNGDECHNQIFMFTEYIRNGEIFRAHGNYRDNGAWHDWVMLRWEPDNNHIHDPIDECQVHYGDDTNHPDQYAYAPGKILAFIKVDEEISAVVNVCQYKHKKSSVFTTSWHLEMGNNRDGPPVPAIHMVDVNSIVRHCLMLPENLEHTKFQEVWSCERWGAQFH